MLKKKQKTKIKHILSSVLAFTVTANLFAVLPVSAENESRTYSGDGYSITYDVTNSWFGNQNVQVTLTNTGDEPLLNWAVKYDSQGDVNDLWNVLIAQEDGDLRIFKNAGYNYEIAPENSVTFGYTVSGEDLGIPSKIVLCSERVERPSDQYNIHFSIDNDWDDGFTGQIFIENLGDNPLEAWRLSFDANFVINGIWNAQIYSSDDPRYTIANDVTTIPIGVGETKSFGINGTKIDAAEPEISNISMSEITINTDFTDITDPDDGSNDNNSYPTDEPFIYAFGEYDPENDLVYIQWYSNIDGVYEILESEDNKTYSTKADKIVGFSDYNYWITEDFDTKYIKVKVTSDDLSAESSPFVITRSEDGYSVDFPDSDEDGLADIYEDMLGTNKNEPDTDGDDLTDFQEVYITGTDPLVYDSVTKGVSDADADLDDDGLSNIDEIRIGTDVKNPDTDGDKLSDGDEVHIYFTDPLVPDSDGDGLEDGAEVTRFGTDPNNPDSNGNGILDGDEKRLQTYVYEVENSECAVTEVQITMEGTGDLEKTMTVESIMDKDVMCSGVVGLVGDPFSIETTSEFDKATITYKVDKSKLGDVEFDNLMFLWYDRENDNFVELETIHDEAHSTVSVETTHFSDYMVVDYVAWVENWEKIRLIFETLLYTTEPRYNITLGWCGVSTSSSADPVTINSDGSVDAKRKDIVVELLSSISKEYDCNYMILGSDWGRDIWSPYSYNRITNNLGVDNWKTDKFYLQFAIETMGFMGKNEFTKVKEAVSIAIITDDYDTHEYSNQPSIMASASNAKGGFYFLDLRSGFDSYLDEIANITGGKYLKYTQENVEYLKTLISETKKIRIVPSDRDKDGFSDLEEKNGWMYMSNGQSISTSTDPDDDDSDGDGLKEYEEMDPEWTEIEIPGKMGNPTYYQCYHKMYSDPGNKDSDYDGFDDNDFKEDDPLRVAVREGDLNCYKTINFPEFKANSLGYSLNFRRFFESNTKFDPELSRASSIFASVIYKNMSFENNYLSRLHMEDFTDPEVYMNNTESEFIMRQFLEYNGFEDAEYHTLTGQHPTDVALGHRYVEYNGQKKEIISVVIRGTSDSLEEWSSNFDIGCDSIFEGKGPIDKPEEWVVQKNHMGFDITATRVMKVIDKYISDHGISEKDIVLWITGHSRGAAVANIVGVRELEEKKRHECFVYTFACPKTTTTYNTIARSYKYIFNIINEDDIITELPLSSWGFKQYGVPKTSSLENNTYTKAVWESKFGDSYLSNSSKRSNLLADFAGLASDRNDCYAIYRTLDRAELFGSKYRDVEQIKKDDFVPYGSEYAQYEYLNDHDGFHWFYKYESTAYFMQFLAQMAAEGKKGYGVGFIYLTTNVPDAFENVKSQFMHYADDTLPKANDYITHPHLPLSYFYISKGA